MYVQEANINAAINQLVAKQKRQEQALEITKGHLLALREIQKQLTTAKK